jgi:hypothetical protein
MLSSILPDDYTFQVDAQGHKTGMTFPRGGHCDQTDRVDESSKSVSEQPGDALFHDHDAVLNSRGAGFAIEQLQRFVDRLVRQAE